MLSSLNLGKRCESLRNKAPKELAKKAYTGSRFVKEDLKLWHSILYEKGWIALSGRRNLEVLVLTYSGSYFG